MHTTARYERILKLFTTISSIRRAQQQRLTYKIYITAKYLILFAGNTDRYSSQPLIGTPNSDTNITRITETALTSAACGLRM